MEIKSKIKKINKVTRLKIHNLFKDKKSSTNKAGLSDATQWLIILLILLCIFVFAYRKKTYIYTMIANESFGGLVYDLDMSEYFFKKLSQQDPIPMFTNYQLSRINFIRGDQQAAIIYANKEIGRAHV